MLRAIPGHFGRDQSTSLWAAVILVCLSSRLAIDRAHDPDGFVLGLEYLSDNADGMSLSGCLSLSTYSQTHLSPS
ncbi:hypothetical protein BV20DRAFT_564710 [Pilatotrama ljubarskyi]|nr:hypothetical protein BV20DRAFT_564710 [Pilatotrama ljubarskyi]